MKKIDVEKELLKIATEEVTKKIKTEQEKAENKIKLDIENVKMILDYIEKGMLYKVNKNKITGYQYVLITKEIFFEDYTKEPEYDWKKGLSIKEYDDWNDRYKYEFKVNGIEYKHIGGIINNFETKLKKEIERINDLHSRCRELENDFEMLLSQEKNVKGFVENYNKLKADEEKLNN